MLPGLYYTFYARFKLLKYCQTLLSLCFASEVAILFVNYTSCLCKEPRDK